MGSFCAGSLRYSGRHVRTASPRQDRAVPQPAYALRRIADGDHDAYIRRWAGRLAAYGGPVRLRFAHEMNGNWYPWAEGFNGNRPGDFVRAWRHVHGLFTAAGAANVQWVWSPVALRVKETQYPGDAYVDRVGLSGFVGGVQLRFARFRGFGALFGPALTQLAAVAPTRPIEISELGVSDHGGDKAAWIRDMFRALPAWPRIDAVVWFNLHKQSDWRIQSSPGVARAFAQGAGAPRYGQRVAAPGSVPLIAGSRTQPCPFRFPLDLAAPPGLAPAEHGRLYAEPRRACRQRDPAVPGPPATAAAPAPPPRPAAG